MDVLLSPSAEQSVIDVGLSRLKSRGEIWRKIVEKTPSGGSTGVHRCMGNYRSDTEAIDKPTEGIAGFRGISEYVLFLPCEADIRASDQYVSPFFAPAWEEQTSYQRGRKVSSSALFGDESGGAGIGDSRLYECIRAGVSGDDSPFVIQRSIQPGQIVVDGTAIWKVFSRVAVLEIIDPRDMSSGVQVGRVLRVRTKVLR